MRASSGLIAMALLLGLGCVSSILGSGEDLAWRLRAPIDRGVEHHDYAHSYLREERWALAEHEATAAIEEFLIVDEFHAETPLWTAQGAEIAYLGTAAYNARAEALVFQGALRCADSDLELATLFGQICVAKGTQAATHKWVSKCNAMQTRIETVKRLLRDLSERRGSHGRELCPPAHDVQTVTARRERLEGP